MNNCSLTGLTMHGSRGKGSRSRSFFLVIVKAKIRKAFALLLGSILLQHAQNELIQCQNKCCAALTRVLLYIRRSTPILTKNVTRPIISFAFAAATAAKF